MPELDIDSFNLWNQHVAAIAETADTMRLPELLMEALCTIIDADSRNILIFGENRKPENLCEWTTDTWPKEDIKTYLKGAYLLDPYYRAGIDGTAPGCYRMRQIAPPAFKDSEYYKTYYASSPINDEIGFVTYLTDGCFSNLGFSRNTDSNPFTEEDFSRIAATLPVVESVLMRYWLATNSGAHQEGSELYVQLEQALNIFGTSVLTPREAEVMRMYLYGHDTRSISERLDISAHTVSAHRKHAYARLDITSQAELFSLFINSMYCFDSDPTKDPLENYLKPPKT